MTDLGDWGVVESASVDEEPEAGSELCYPHLEAFVVEQLAPTYRRELEGPGRTWCPEWWRHAEAITRLEALWRAWEQLRLDPATGISVWFRDHADHHMAVLLDPDGPFKGCSPERGHSTRLEPLPTEPAPLDIFEIDPDDPFGELDDTDDADPLGDADDAAVDPLTDGDDAEPLADAHDAALTPPLADHHS